MKHRRRLKWPAWVILFLLLIAAVWGGVTQLFPSKEEVKVEVDQEDMSNYPGLNLQTRTTESETYTTSISDLETTSQKVNQSIQQWIKEKKDSFYRTVEERDFEERARGHLNIQVETKPWSKNKYSLIFTSYEYVGGANGNETVMPLVIDLEKDRVLKIEDVLKEDTGAMKKLQTEVKKRLEDNENLQGYILEEDMKKALSDPGSWKWSLSKECLVIHFNKYEVAAGVAGNVQVNIPLDKVTSYLKEDIINEMDILQEPEEPETENKPDQVQLDEDGKYIALTFDDGPHQTVTPKVLDILEKHNAKATFFMLGSQVEYYPTIARQVAEEGHEIGNHTENHMDLSNLGPESIRREIQQSSDEIEKATGQEPQLVRPPYGALNKHVEAVSKQMGTPIINWSVDSLDWQTLQASAVIKEVGENATSGAIVLLHDIHPSTAEALPELLTQLEQRGYQFVTVSQLLEIQNKTSIVPYYGKLK